MGCCKSRALNYFNKNLKIEFADKRSQISRLHDILKRIMHEIERLETQVDKGKSNSDFMVTRDKRACYLAKMIVFIKWTIKVVEVNQEDRRIDDVIDKAEDLISEEDDFLLNSLENKIKFLINVKK